MHYKRPWALGPGPWPLVVYYYINTPLFYIILYYIILYYIIFYSILFYYIILYILYIIYGQSMGMSVATWRVYGTPGILLPKLIKRYYEWAICI